MEDNDNPYTILGVPRDATQQEIKSAYRKLALRHHPDKQQTEQGKQQATVVFAKISNAYEILGDPEQRQNYDREAHRPQVHRPRSKQPRQRQHDDFFHHTQFHDPFSVFEAVFREEFGGDLFGGLHRRHANHMAQNMAGMGGGMQRDPFANPFFSGGGMAADPFFGGMGMGMGNPFGGMGMGGGMDMGSPFGGMGGMGMGGGMGASPFAAMDQMMNMHQNMMRQPMQGNNFVSTSFSTSNNVMGGGGVGSSTTTTTRIVNGQRQSVTERVVQRADGTIERHVDLSGDNGFPPQRQRRQQLPASRNAARPALEAPRQESKRRSSQSKPSRTSQTRNEAPPQARNSNNGESKRKRRSSSKLQP